MIPFSTIRRIAIFRRNGFGDVLCTIPLALRCKELMPQATVTLFIEKNAFCLAPYLQGPDEIAEIPSDQNKYIGLAKLVWQRRKESFDLAISAKTNSMKLMNMTLYALRAPYRAAYTKGNWHDKLINCPRLYVDQTSIHQALQAIHLIDPEMTELPKRLYPVLGSLEGERLFPEKTLLISISNNRAGSILSPERIVELLNTLAAEMPFAVAISCLSQDLGKAKKIASCLHMKCKIFISNQFSQFLTLLQSADAIFVGDGGIVHLSSALRKPALFLFGGTKISQWGPMNPLASTLFSPSHVMEIPPSEILEKLRRLIREIP